MCIERLVLHEDTTGPPLAATDGVRALGHPAFIKVNNVAVAARTMIQQRSATCAGVIRLAIATDFVVRLEAGGARGAVGLVRRASNDHGGVAGRGDFAAALAGARHSACAH